jgi:hypothetical protein
MEFLVSGESKNPNLVLGESTFEIECLNHFATTTQPDNLPVLGGSNLVRPSFISCQRPAERCSSPHFSLTKHIASPVFPYLLHLFHDSSAMAMKRNSYLYLAALLLVHTSSVVDAQTQTAQTTQVITVGKVRISYSPFEQILT